MWIWIERTRWILTQDQAQDYAEVRNKHIQWTSRTITTDRVFPRELWRNTQNQGEARSNSLTNTCYQTAQLPIQWTGEGPGSSLGWAPNTFSPIPQMDTRQSKLSECRALVFTCLENIIVRWLLSQRRTLAAIICSYLVRFLDDEISQFVVQADVLNLWIT